MSDKSKIEWTEATWNPVTGCSPVSAGCTNCYAARIAKRLRGRFGYPTRDSFQITVHESKFEQPLHWKKSRMVFVCSMGDLFHEKIPKRAVRHVWEVMARCPQHFFLILTKRAGRMYAAFRRPAALPQLPNVWLGISAENRPRYAERVSFLRRCPAAVRFLSLEPLLGPIDDLDLSGIDWVIVGGESGPGARPMRAVWVRNIRDQCVTASVPFFFKARMEGGKRISMPVLDGIVWRQMPEGL